MKWFLVLIFILSFSSYAEKKKSNCEKALSTPLQEKSPTDKNSKNKPSNNTTEKTAKEETATPKTNQKEAEEIIVTDAEKKVIVKSILYMFKKTLVLPRVKDLSAYSKIPKKTLEKFIGDKISMELWNQIEAEHPNYFTKLKKTIARTFIISLKSNNVKWRNRTPDIKRLYAKYVQKNNNDESFSYPKSIETEYHLSAMLGKKVPENKLNGAVPVLFPKGMSEVEQLAKSITPSAFVNYIDSKIFSLEEDQKTADMILKAKGAVVSSVTAGIPINKDFFQSLLGYAKQKKVPIILMPANRQTEGIDPYLLSMPDQVRVLTHTIEFSEYLRIWNIPIMTKNVNPFAGLNTYGQGRRGQTQIVSHPQQNYMTVATADNKDGTHGLWSTGSISKAIYPSNQPSGQRVSETAKNRHAIGALVLELSDKKSGPNKNGLPGFYHIRPLEYFDHRENNGTFGFMDAGYLYTHDKKIKAGVDILIPGDLHDYNASQTLLTIYEDIIKKHNVKTLVLHDALDGQSHNHHEAARLNSKLEKYNKGELNIEAEMHGLVQTMNGFLEKFPELEIVLIDSNHHYWLENLINKPDAIEDMVNREFLIELLYARAHLGVDSFEYMFNHHRQRLHEGLESRIAYKKKNNSIYISAPERVRVLKAGEPYIVGPDHASVHLQFHGHKGANGARGGMVSHASAVDRGVTGDSHQPNKKGKSVNVGVSTGKNLDYTQGGYSSWGQGAALVNESNGSTQLLNLEERVGAYIQAPENGFLPLTAQPTPKVYPTDNDLLPNVTITDQFSNKFSRSK